MTGTWSVTSPPTPPTTPPVGEGETLRFSVGGTKHYGPGTNPPDEYEMFYQTDVQITSESAEGIGYDPDLTELMDVVRDWLDSKGYDSINMSAGHRPESGLGWSPTWTYTPAP